jgi:DNA topoisomerase-3
LKKKEKQHLPKELLCPKCQKGTILKGSKAYGCSDFKHGCNFIFPFEKLRNLSADKKLTKELVYNIISNTANWTR